jgi:predicted naringenin-chalcone synthase
MLHAYLNEIGTAVPAHEAQSEFLATLNQWIPDPAVVTKLQLIAKRAGIEHRYTVLDQVMGGPGSGAFYEFGNFPGTAARMQVYQHEAPKLAVQAARNLEARGVNLASVTHLVITSCTGFYAPGLDVDLIRLLNLPGGVRRTIVGFMGCYAGITGLRTASDIVRADPEARVLMINLELCTLHLQQDAPIDRLVASMLFSDGCAAALISGKPEGFRLDSFSTILSLEDADKMSWLVADQGFAMTLDACIPERIRSFLSRDPELLADAKQNPESLWAIHPGGRAILDAVKGACALTAEQITPARSVLARYGNMSSASVIFVFEELLRTAPRDRALPGAAMAFGPGLTLEALEFSSVPLARPRSEIQTAMCAA